MADAYTTTATLTQATTAYERMAYFALRSELYFDACATIKPTRQSHPGSAVLFNIYNDMAPQITALSETTDVDAIAISDNEVTISLNEYGAAAITTARIRGWSYLGVSAEVANVIGYNAGLSLDCLARNPLVAGTNVIFAGNATSRVTIDATDNLKARNVRVAVANMSDANVQRLNGYYRGFFAAATELDLREETGAAAWRDPHTYAQPQQIWNGETGLFEGVAFVSTPRLTAPNLAATQGGPGGFVDGGAGGTVDIYPTIILGNQALAKTFSRAVSAPLPQIVLGTVVDKLQRLVPIGWYWNGGYGRFREESIRRIEASSTIGAN